MPRADYLDNLKAGAQIDVAARPSGLRLAEPAAEKQKVLGGILPIVPKEIISTVK
jgi:hypothetical protein